MTEQAPPSHWFQREDESDDAVFYASPRFVTHIDQATIFALTDYYREFLAGGGAILDLMSSWISHYPSDLESTQVTGLGMNADELQHNPQLTDWNLHNLNRNPTLPYKDATYDRATIAVSIQYLTQPVAVLADARRVLKPGGRIAIAMSHRLFPTKAIAAFVQMSPEDRIRLVFYYLTAAGFEDVEFIDRSPENADPLWLVVANA